MVKNNETPHHNGKEAWFLDRARAWMLRADKMYQAWEAEEKAMGDMIRDPMRMMKACATGEMKVEQEVQSLRLQVMSVLAQMSQAALMLASMDMDGLL